MMCFVVVFVFVMILSFLVRGQAGVPWDCTAVR